MKTEAPLNAMIAIDDRMRKLHESIDIVIGTEVVRQVTDIRNGYRAQLRAVLDAYPRHGGLHAELTRLLKEQDED